MHTLYDPIQLGGLTLPNRFAMAPLTRNRSPGAVPGPYGLTYYTQRATAGLIVQFGGGGYPFMTGIMKELLDELIARGDAVDLGQPNVNYPVDPDGLKDLARRTGSTSQRRRCRATSR